VNVLVRASDRSEPVDAVYLWIDGSAPGTRARLSAALAEHSPDVSDEAAGRRFRDHDELRYSLRSLEQRAPWIRRVHVVTDGDPPPWLELGDHCAHVTHDQIFSDGCCLPSFNSYAIEWQLHHIPGVARQFLYVNDDMFSGDRSRATRSSQARVRCSISPKTRSHAIATWVALCGGRSRTQLR
jgi:hypothetical protein